MKKYIIIIFLIFSSIFCSRAFYQKNPEKGYLNNYNYQILYDTINRDNSFEIRKTLRSQPLQFMYSNPNSKSNKNDIQEMDSINIIIKESLINIDTVQRKRQFIK